jgi:hypothetical protein
VFSLKEVAPTGGPLHGPRQGSGLDRTVVGFDQMVELLGPTNRRGSVF